MPKDEQKDHFVHVRDHKTLAAIKRNGLLDPLPLRIDADGAWVYSWSLEQYRLSVADGMA
jgi:hypothetical protein